MRNVSHKSCTENQNTNFVFSAFLFFENRAADGENVEKYCRAGQTTEYNMAHAHSILDT